MALVSNRPERVEVGSSFVTDDGDLRIDAARPFGDNWLMTFAGVDSRERAEALRGTVLRARPLEDEEAWWVHELIGSEVLDTDGAISARCRPSWPTPPVTCWSSREVRWSRCGSSSSDRRAGWWSTSPPGLFDLPSA